MEIPKLFMHQSIYNMLQYVYTEHNEPNLIYRAM